MWYNWSWIRLLSKTDWNIYKSILAILFKILIAITEAVITVEGKTILLVSFSDFGFIGPSDSRRE